MSMAPYDSRAVANEILKYANSKGIKLTLMQLIKLVYLANGWSLALLDRQLVEDRVQAWQYGPVYPRLYKAFNRFGSGPITTPARNAASGLTAVPYGAAFENEELDVIRSVVDAYGTLHAFQLSNLMHRPGTPWTETFSKDGAYSEIPQDLIKKHFVRIQSERTAAD